MMCAVCSAATIAPALRLQGTLYLSSLREKVWLSICACSLPWCSSCHRGKQFDCTSCFVDGCLAVGTQRHHVMQNSVTVFVPAILPVTAAELWPRSIRGGPRKRCYNTGVILRFRSPKCQRDHKSRGHFRPGAWTSSSDSRHSTGYRASSIEMRVNETPAACRLSFLLMLCLWLSLLICLLMSFFCCARCFRPKARGAATVINCSLAGGNTHSRSSVSWESVWDFHTDDSGTSSLCRLRLGFWVRCAS